MSVTRSYFLCDTLAGAGALGDSLKRQNVAFSDDKRGMDSVEGRRKVGREQQLHGQLIFPFIITQEGRDI